MATAMAVKNENEKFLGKLQVGETKLQALDRLSQGFLFDNEGIGLQNNQLIALEGAPYVLNPLLLGPSNGELL